MSFEFVRDVDKQKDSEEFLERKREQEKREAMAYPPKLESMEDFDKVIENLRKYGQRTELVECEARYREPPFKPEDWVCRVFGVNSIIVDREKEKATLEVAHREWEQKNQFFLQLNNILEATVREPTMMADIIYERRHGGRGPVKRYPDHVTDIYNDRGVCSISWDDRGPYDEESPHHIQGFRINCGEMTPEQFVEKMRDRVEYKARYKYPTKYGAEHIKEPVPEDVLLEVAKEMIADRKRCKTLES